MAGIKPLSEQTLMNNYVFSMVMREPKRIKPLLEHIRSPVVKPPLCVISSGVTATVLGLASQFQPDVTEKEFAPCAPAISTTTGFAV